MPQPDGIGTGAHSVLAGRLSVSGDVRHARALSWQSDGRDWPSRDASGFIEAGGMTWHVQRMGAGPVLLLLHGTGASTHSWRDLAPALAARYTVVAPDLPGHGFTSAPDSVEGYSLPGMAAAVGTLLAALELRSAMVVGHSAGAAIGLRMLLDGRVTPDRVVSLNGALLPFRGLPGQLFSPAARLLARLDFVPRIVAQRARDPAAVLRLLRDTGSVIDERGVELYRRLMSSPTHVAATITMMSQWDLAPLTREYRDVDVPVLLVVGEDDGTVPPAEAWRVARLLPKAEVHPLPGLGHLAHEERPREVAAIVSGFAGRKGQSDA